MRAYVCDVDAILECGVAVVLLQNLAVEIADDRISEIRVAIRLAIGI
jgi:hypothetical protein